MTLGRTCMNQEVPDQIFDDMESTVDRLIDVAEQLKEASIQIISSDMIVPLQKEQDRLLEELAIIEKKFQRKYPENVSNSTQVRDRIKTKLETFQLLNHEFITNLNNSKEVINFQKKNVK